MEDLFQYLWKYRMLGRSMKLTDGRKLKILNPGILNRDAGPDFFNAKIEIDGEVWAGNVEIHIKASDWYRHGHDKDTAYDSVMLHAVAVTDSVVRRSDGSVIPMVVLTMPKNFFDMYALLREGGKSVKCSGMMRRLSSLQVRGWMESLGMERMHKKGERIIEMLAETGNNWTQTSFMIFARGLGFSLNGLPFEMLARSLPLNYLTRHSDNIFQLEAMLFGQAGMLDSSFHIFDEYYQGLCREYYFLARKYGLRPLRGDIWKLSRIRPQSFPHRRIALLASSIQGGFTLMGDILEAIPSLEKLYDIFNWKLSPYWAEHFNFDQEGKSLSVGLGKGSLDSLLINVAVPLALTHYSRTGDFDRAEQVMDVLRELPPETNSIIKSWINCGIKPCDSFESQALLHLRKEYCDADRCLDCRYCYSFLKTTVEDELQPKPHAIGLC